MAAEMRWQDVLLGDIKRDEGLRLKPYLCTAGVWTIGYGHTKGVTQRSPAITAQQAEDLLRQDLEAAIEDARLVVPCFDNLNGPRKTVVANMSFNLGRHRLAEFKNTIRSICSGDYKDASLRMLQSKWAGQVGQRARRLAARMASGSY